MSIIYLYVKQCSHCGLKYFGNTTRDPYKYNGSGKYWQRHVKTHGTKHIKTLDVYSFEDQKLCNEFALNFSEVNNIVESSEWANLMPETGLRGLVYTDDMRKRISESNHTRVITPEQRLKRSEQRLGKKLGPQSKETKLKRSVTMKGRPSPRKGVAANPEAKVKLKALAESRRGIQRTQDVIDKISISRKGKGTGPQSPEHIAKRIEARINTINKNKTMAFLNQLPNPS